MRGVEQTGLQGEINLKIKLKKSGSNSLMIGTELKTKGAAASSRAARRLLRLRRHQPGDGNHRRSAARQEPLFDKDSNVKSIHRNKN